MSELTQEQQEAIGRCIEAFKKLAEQIIEAFKPIVEWFMKDIWPVLKRAYKIAYYNKKHMMIYNRTKSKRIQKKQIMLIRKRCCI